MEKRAYLSEMFADSDVALMKRLHQAMDPRGLSNPGKMFPEDDAGSQSRGRKSPAAEASGPATRQRDAPSAQDSGASGA